jgi:hypothetical protein
LSSGLGDARSVISGASIRAFDLVQSVLTAISESAAAIYDIGYVSALPSERSLPMPKNIVIFSDGAGQEARLFCNLIRSYLNFLLDEYESLQGRDHR